MYYCERLLKKKFDPLENYSTIPLDTVLHLHCTYN